MTSFSTLNRAALLLTFAAGAAPAFADDAAVSHGDCAYRPYSAMHQRFVDRAAEGPAALRRYVGLVQPLQQLDYDDAVAWLDGERVRLQACRTAALRDTTARR
ncbi:MAG: hypothetical protein K8R60_14560 [Burkholderiales bacterium]|nr:hypothetical protein [Burkholderiales bacterium]